MSGLVFGDMGYELHVEGYDKPQHIVGWFSDDSGVVPFFLADDGHMERPDIYRVAKKPRPKPVGVRIPPCSQT